MFSLARTVVALCWFVCCFWASPACAQLDGLSEVGHSYQSDARGGCEVSIGDTALAQVRQPASLVLQPTAGKFDSKITNLFVVNDWNDPLDSSATDEHEALSYNLAAVHQITETVSGGIAFETGGWSSNFNKGLALFPASKNSFSLKRYSVYANLAKRFGNGWAVGVGPHIEVATMSTNIALGSGKLIWPGSSTVGAGFQLGALRRFWKRYQIGISYASPTWLGPLNSSNASFITATNHVVSVGGIGLHNSSLPGRLSFGVSSEVSKKMDVAVEGGYLNYGHSIFGKAPVYGLFNTDFSPGFRDIWLINVGTDYKFNEHWSGSVGYTGNTNAVDNRTMVPIFISNTRNMFTCGLRYNGGRWWTGIAYIVGLPSFSRSGANIHGPDYFDTTVRQMLQSVNCGVGFSF